MGVGVFQGPEKPLPTLPLVVAAQLPPRSQKLTGMKVYTIEGTEKRVIN